MGQSSYQQSTNFTGLQDPFTGQTYGTPNPYPWVPPESAETPEERRNREQREADAAANLANRPTIQTPEGTFAYDPATNTFSLTDSPERAEARAAQQRIMSGRSAIAEALMGNVGQDISKPFDWNGLPGLGYGQEARQRAEDAIYRRASSRLDPMWQQREEQTRARLLAQGLDPGSEAYNEQVAGMGRERTDAYQQALDASIMGGGNEMSRQFGMDLGARQQGIEEMMQQRYGSLNALNALLQGQQVGAMNMPQYNPYQSTNVSSYRPPTMPEQEDSGMSWLGPLAGIAGTVLGGPIGGALAGYLGKQAGTGKYENFFGS